MLSQKEKIEELKDTILFLYEKESKSKSYISRLLNVDRKLLTYYLNTEWEAIQATKRYLVPSKAKQLKANKQRIINMLDSNFPITDIEKELHISSLKEFIESNKELLHHYNLYIKRKNRIQEPISTLNTIPNEVWTTILGYSNYMVSNMGRVKSKTKYGYRLLTPTPNALSNRLYISIVNDNGKRKNLIVARLVAHAFCRGYSEERNTVNHIDGNVQNNRADNLEWVSQKDNNIHKAEVLRYANDTSYSIVKPFKKAIYNGYEFSTLNALARFLNIPKSTLLYKVHNSKIDISFTY